MEIISVKTSEIVRNSISKVIPVKRYSVKSHTIKNGEEVAGPDVEMIEYYHLYWDYLPASPGGYKIGIQRSYWRIEKRLYDNFIKNTRYYKQ